ncbi:MAG: YhfC family glutamic-type intramembrane protease [Chloroflexota bacterium]
MWEQMLAFLESFFIYPDLKWDLMLVGILLGIAFGAIWLCAHWPPLFKKPWFWAVAVVSAFLTLLAVTFVQIPLQYWAGQALMHFWSGETLVTWLLLAGIPQILLSGLVQEGAKMVPMVAWWWRSGRNIDPKLGLAIGAIAGAGFGIFEAVWVHNQMLAAGWTMQALQTDGFMGIAGFWERFFAIGLHVAASALAGYGLAKGKGWQFYLIAAGLHALLNYSVVLLQRGYLTFVQVETYVAVVAVAAAVWALLLRWGRTEEEEMIEPAETGDEINIEVVREFLEGGFSPLFPPLPSRGWG